MYVPPVLRSGRTAWLFLACALLWGGLLDLLGIRGMSVGEFEAATVQEKVLHSIYFLGPVFVAMGILNIAIDRWQDGQRRQEIVDDTDNIDL